MKKQGVLCLVLLTSMAQAYKGERAIDAEVLNGVRLLVGGFPGLLGKVCSIQMDSNNLVLCSPIPITMPMTITQPGEYCISQDLTGDGVSPVITIAADSVCLDLNCHVLDGLGQPAVQVTNQNKVLINHGCVTGTGTIISLSNVDGAVLREVQFQGGSTSLSVASSNLVHVEHCDISGSSGQRGIFCSGSKGVSIDGVLISHNDLTGAGIELFGSQCILIENSEISNNGNGTAPTEFTGILASNTVDVAVSNCMLCDLVATTSLRGIYGVTGSFSWNINHTILSDFLVTGPGSLIEGILGLSGSLVIDNCAFKQFVSSAASGLPVRIRGIVLQGTSCCTNNCLILFQVNPFSSTQGEVFGIQATGPANIIQDNMATGMAGNATGFAYDIAGSSFIVQENTAESSLVGPGGFSISTLSFGSSALRNQSIGTGSIVASPNPIDVVAWDSTTGTYSTTLTPYSNLILA